MREIGYYYRETPPELSETEEARKEREAAALEKTRAILAEVARRQEEEARPRVYRRSSEISVSEASELSHGAEVPVPQQPDPGQSQPAAPAVQAPNADDDQSPITRMAKATGSSYPKLHVDNARHEVGGAQPAAHPGVSKAHAREYVGIVPRSPTSRFS